MMNNQTPTNPHPNPSWHSHPQPSTSPGRTERYHPPITESVSISSFSEEDETERFEIPQRESPEKEDQKGSHDETSNQDLNSEDKKSEPFPPQQPSSWWGRILLLMGIVVAPICAYWIYPIFFIPTGIIALFFSGALIGIFRGLDTNRLYFHTFCLGVLGLWYGLMISVGYPTWYANYQKFQKEVKALAIKVENVYSNKEFALDEKIKTFLENLEVRLQFSLGERIKIFFQCILWSFVFLYLPVLILATTPGLGYFCPPAECRGLMGWLGPRLFAGINRIAHFMLIRVIKALLITILCTVGFYLSKIESFWFVTGIVFCFALVCNLSPFIALLSGGIMAFASVSLFYSLFGVVLTSLVLWITERRFYWYFHLLPIAKYYQLSPELLEYQGPIMGRLWSWVPHLISAGIFLALGYGIYEIIQVHKKDRGWHQDVREANAFYQEGNYAKAIESYKTIIQETWPYHPGNITLVYRMLRARLSQGEYERALKIAKDLESWTPPVPTHWKDRFRHELLILLSSRDLEKEYYPSKAYEIIVETIWNQEETLEYLQQCASRLSELKPGEFYHLLAQAQVFLQQKNYQSAQESCKQGLAKYPKRKELLFSLAKVYLGQKDFNKCIEVCDELLEMDREDIEVRRIRMKAIQEKESGKTTSSVEHSESSGQQEKNSPQVGVGFPVQEKIPPPQNQ